LTLPQWGLRWCLLWLLALAALHAAAAATTPVPKVQVPGKSSKPAKAVPPPKPVLAPPAGNLVIIGGGLRAENAEVWQRIVQLAGGKGARIGVFGSASINPKRRPRPPSTSSISTAPRRLRFRLA
jgi:cyanophycinase